MSEFIISASPSAAEIREAYAKAARMREAADDLELAAESAERESERIAARCDPDMSAGDAIDHLEVLASAEDPIEMKGWETTPTQLTYEDHAGSGWRALGGTAGPLAREVIISYWGGSPVRMIKNGTLRGMVLDRTAYSRSQQG